MIVINECPMSVGTFLNITATEIECSIYKFKDDTHKGTSKLIESSSNTKLMDKITILSSKIIRLEELKTSPEWDNYTIWNLLISFFGDTPTINSLVCRNAITYSNKLNKDTFNKLFGGSLFELVIPHNNISSFLDTGLSVYTGSGYPFITNINDAQIKQGVGDDVRTALLSTMAMTGPTEVKPDTTATYAISVVDTKNIKTSAPVDVYLQNENGYLPLTVLKNVQDTCTFKLVTDHLSPGDTVTIKAGFKYWSSLAKLEINIV